MTTTEDELTKRLISNVTQFIIDSWLRKCEVSRDKIKFPKVLSAEICRYHHVILLFGVSTFQPKQLLELADLSYRADKCEIAVTLLMEYFCMIDFENVDQNRFINSGPRYFFEGYDKKIKYVLSDHESILLSQTFLYLIKKKLISFRAIKDNSSEIAQKYCKLICSEIMTLSEYLIVFLENTLIPISKIQTSENYHKYDKQGIPDAAYDIYNEIVNYHRICADCYRYICEINKSHKNNLDLEYYKKRAESHYKEGDKYCDEPDKYKLRGYNQILQRLKFNYCVFLAEICDNKELAVKIGSKAFIDCIEATSQRSMYGGPSCKDEYALIELFKEKYLDKWNPNWNSNGHS